MIVASRSGVEPPSGLSTHHFARIVCHKFLSRRAEPLSWQEKELLFRQCLTRVIRLSSVGAWRKAPLLAGPSLPPHRLASGRSAAPKRLAINSGVGARADKLWHQLRDSERAHFRVREKFRRCACHLLTRHPDRISFFLSIFINTGSGCDQGAPLGLIFCASTRKLLLLIDLCAPRYQCRPLRSVGIRP
jgi:hypothetical protein